MLPEGGKNAEKIKKMAHIYRCCGFIPHFTQQTQDNNIHTLTTNMITEKRSNIFALALSITPLVKKKKSDSIFVIQNMVIVYSIPPL